MARVANQPGFAKDQKTGAILNISKADAAAWKARAEVLKAQKVENDAVKTQLKNIQERLEKLEKTVLNMSFYSNTDDPFK